MNPYGTSSESFVTADAVVMETVRSQFEAFKAAITKLRDRAVLNETEDRLDDLLNCLIDLDGDHISPTITLIEERLGEFEAKRDREHERHLQAAQ
jgi:hypothetical protein